MVNVSVVCILLITNIDAQESLLNYQGSLTDDGTPEVDDATPPAEPYVVTVTMLDHAFAMPDTIPSGWVTLRLSNKRAEEIHEISLGRLPEEVTYEEYRQQVIPGWEAIWEEMRAGELALEDLYNAIGEHLPEWALEVGYVHSRNLVSAGRISESNLKLEPGTYSVECWVKTEKGDIHISHGMIHELTVIEKGSGAPKPEADIEIVLAADRIAMEDKFGLGRYTVAVVLEEDEEGNPVHNDVHLIRLTDDTDMEEVVAWLD